jgi:hypothetical protein
MVLRSSIPDLIARFSDPFKVLSDAWARWVNRSNAGRDELIPGQPWIRSAVLEASELLNRIRHQVLPFKFISILKSVSLLIKGGGKEATVQELLQVAISLSRALDLVSVFLMLHLFALGSPTFVRLSSEEDLMRWSEFQGVMVAVILQDKDLEGSFFSLQEELSACR